MTDEPENNLLNLWQDQPTEISPMLLADVHARALKFQSHQGRLLVVLAVCAVLAVVGSGFAIVRIDDGWARLGFAALALGMLFILYYRYSHRVVAAGEISSPSRDCFDFYRTTLLKRIKLLRTTWLWYFLPALPGLALILYRMDQTIDLTQPRHPEAAAMAHLILLGGEILFVAAYAVEMVWVWFKIRRLKRELAILDGVERRIEMGKPGKWSALFFRRSRKAGQTPFRTPGHVQPPTIFNMKGAISAFIILAGVLILILASLMSGVTR